MVTYISSTLLMLKGCKSKTQNKVNKKEHALIEK